MQIISFRVYKYRNIEDSGEVSLSDALTCIVGKNQSGKTALLRALHKFNPHDSDPYIMNREWPRGQRTKRDNSQKVCDVRFRLTDAEVEALAKLTSQEMNTDEVVISKDYQGRFDVAFPGMPDLFPEALHPNSIDGICDTLPAVPKQVGPEFMQAAKSCLDEVRRTATEGRFSSLTEMVTTHGERLSSALSPDNPQRQAEDAFHSEYVNKLGEMKTAFQQAPTIRQQAHDYLVTQIPTFIYMDDFREFRGRADLSQVRDRRAKKGLNPDDETFLMILQLAGLDLDTLIEQGDSGDENIIHERQLDLQDAANTLTRDVAGRWEQNKYRIEFRADGQTFFTEIEEVDKDVGMIPLEEQSKGFVWFFSFDLRFMHDSDGTFEGCVLLLDEPGLHLHPGGQADLLKRLDSYAEKNTLIYTTHLPFLIDLREPERIKVINQVEDGAVVSDNFSGCQPDEKLTLQTALGIRANQSYLISDKNLVVEGAHDYWILTELSNVFQRSGKEGIPEDIMITAGGGAPEVVHMATFMIGQGLEVVSLFDSDKEGRSQEERLRKAWITRYKDAKSGTVLLGDTIHGVEKVATIEDLFPEEYYIEKVRESHQEKIADAGMQQEQVVLEGDGPILPRVEVACSKHGLMFNKGSVAKAIRKDLVKSATVQDLPDGVEDKAEKLFSAIRRAFGV
ncbi:MAG: hypothetical protein DBO99_19315 [gamma proteobacterium symbiont of Ctena orbiculata]|nr:MAG: hypothetical protein DBO99_19315 [gamma proteobacterium symbiont of Ctena orbiculata]